MSSAPAEKEVRSSSSSQSQPAANDAVDNATKATGSQDGPSAADAPDASEPPAHTPMELTLILIALCLAVFLAAIDSVIITPAMPTITKELNASDSGFAWIGSAYLLALSATSPFWSKVSDIFGRKPILIVANLIFLVGSLVAALSNSLEMLIAARAIQGTGGGGLITLVEISVGDMFSQRERGLFYGIYGAVWAVSTAIGPVIGGVFTERATWRWCFWFNLPFDGLSLIITIIFLHIHNPKTPLVKGLKAIDWVGSVLIVGATLMFLIGLESGGVSHPWGSAFVICLIVFGVVAYVLFAVYERYARYPVIPKRIFAGLSRSCTFAVVFCHGAGFIAPIFFLPLYFQAALGATPIESGVWMLAIAISFTLSGIIMGIVIQRTGHYLWIIRGSMALFTLALGLMITYGPTRDWPRIIIFQILLAAGIGANMQTLVIAIQALVAPEDIGVATGTLNFVRNLATAMSVVLGQVIFQSMLGGHSGAMRSAGIPADVVSRLVNGGAISGFGLTDGFTEPQRAAYATAFSDAMSKMWIFYTVLIFVGFVLSFGIRSKALMTSHEVTKTGLDAEEAKRQKFETPKDGADAVAVNGEKAENA
ncbi:major facilitator superfamily-domain-containing protein [Chaetomium fimeti]|uniref:Major facilitator superfamily-domain-containing protein n=1 Tax=Chaetomium fimeti TaxID=1854472 RepID=A0AAE0LMC3_9PEZI|nr:major facilitator superfamily-domain-containing protein [Chaetomium fimeti]